MHSLPPGTPHLFSGGTAPKKLDVFLLNKSKHAAQPYSQVKLNNNQNKRKNDPIDTTLKIELINNITIKYLSLQTNYATKKENKVMQIIQQLSKIHNYAEKHPDDA